MSLRAVPHDKSTLFSNVPREAASKHVHEPEKELLPSNKRPKTEPAKTENAPARKPQPTGQDQVVSALSTLIRHLSSSKKFTKSSELLRQLILEEKIGPEHSKLLFEV